MLNLLFLNSEVHRPRQAARRDTHRKHAFTIVELMVTLAIIAILLALLLPAVQQARQVARRTECSAKMRQLGIAMHSYHDLHRTFPAANLGTTGQSPFVALLPQMGQAALFARIDFLKDIQDPAYHEINRTPVPWLLCPSDISESFPGSTNYVANSGTGPHVNGEYRGMFTVPHLGDEQVSASAVTDGLSNTAAFSEVLVTNRQHHPYRAVFRAPRRADVDALCHECESLDPSSQTGDQYYRGWSWTDGNLPSTLYNHAQVPNRRACTNNTHVPTGLYPPASLHSSGVNLCLADGSVRFVSETIDRTIWRAIGTRRGAESVGQY